MTQIENSKPNSGKRALKVKSSPEIPTEDDDSPVIEQAAEPQKVEKTAEEPDNALQELKKQLEAEKQARLQEQEARIRAERQSQSARTETEETNLRLVENAIETVKANMASLKAAYAQAAAIGEWDRAADVQEQMATNGARLLQLENGKAAMQEAAKQPKPQPRADDPVEALASQLTPRSAAWVRAHPEYARDKVLYGKMIAAHNLIASDYVADSDGYFSAIEEVLKIRPARVAEPEAEDDGFSEAAAPVKRRTSPPAAPVTRNNVSSSITANPRAVRLSSEQVEIAALNKMTPQEYWDQLQRARSAGEVH